MTEINKNVHAPTLPSAPQPVHEQKQPQARPAPVYKPPRVSPALRGLPERSADGEEEQGGVEGAGSLDKTAFGPGRKQSDGQHGGQDQSHQNADQAAVRIGEQCEALWQAGGSEAVRQHLGQCSSQMLLACGADFALAISEMVGRDPDGLSVEGCMDPLKNCFAQFLDRMRPLYLQYGARSNQLREDVIPMLMELADPLRMLVDPRLSGLSPDVRARIKALLETFYTLAVIVCISACPPPAGDEQDRPSAWTPGHFSEPVAAA